jgi:hypothetical protein
MAKVHVVMENHEDGAFPIAAFSEEQLKAAGLYAERRNANGGDLEFEVRSVPLDPEQGQYGFQVVVDKRGNVLDEPQGVDPEEETIRDGEIEWLYVTPQNEQRRVGRFFAATKVKTLAQVTVLADNAEQAKERAVAIVLAMRQWGIDATREPTEKVAAANGTPTDEDEDDRTSNKLGPCLASCSTLSIPRYGAADSPVEEDSTVKVEKEEGA